MAAQGQIYGPNGESIGASQLNHYYERTALVEARKEQFFGQLASVKAMPKNSGKQIKQYHIIPLLDDANINDQGIDASGATYVGGNLYGSSKDIGTINGKLPVLSETGGRVNRVGFTRKELTGSFENFGFFSEYSKDLVDFDSDAELLNHMNRETLNGAMEITEDSLQIDLINNANTIRFLGSNTSIEGTQAYVLSYADLMRLSIDLDNNRCPKHTTIITGSRNIDTKTINACRVAYIGSELIPLIEAMTDYHGNPAFVPVRQYAAGTTVLNGERGAVGDFRFVVVPEMVKWAGIGADSTDPTWHTTGGKLDVFPLLVVGDEAFTTIGFQTDGKSMKFKIIHKQPSEDTADKQDPYGKMGFMSIQWWYGFMALRPERIGLIPCVAFI